MLWDNGQHLGRTSLEWADPELIDMIQTSWETRSALPNENFIYLKKKGRRLRIRQFPSNSIVIRLIKSY